MATYEDKLMNYVYDQWKKNFDDALLELFNLYNSNENASNNQKNERKLTFYLWDEVDSRVPKPEINAYALYKDEEKEDAVYMTKALFNCILNMSDFCESDSTRASTMALFTGLLVLAHEVTHLYAGHCQLCKANRLSMIYSKEFGLAEIDHQTLEYEADKISAYRMAEMVDNNIKARKENSHNNEKEYILLCLKSIDGFFNLLRYLESIYNPNNKTHLHPPAFLRGLSYRALFLSSLENEFNITILESYNKSFFINHILFCRYYRQKPYYISDEYVLLENSLYQLYLDKILNNFDRNIDGKLFKYRRLSQNFRSRRI